MVSGGSRGLGLAISVNLAAAGYRAIAIARKESRELTSAVAASARAGTDALQFLPVDLEDVDAIPRLVASIVGFTGYSGLSVYGATKASMLGFINVNAVATGFLHTGMMEGLTDSRRAQIARRGALRKLLAVDDVSEAVEFLLGDRSAAITGTVLTVDAGSTA
jgi:NAD(P)-dependent dehydrogenase (short-subunit alcohol dehydrogenase family)